MFFCAKAALQPMTWTCTSTSALPKISREKFEFIPIFDDVANIVKHANSDSKEFMLETTLGTFERRTLPLDDE